MGVDCVDEDSTNLVPYLSHTVGTAESQEDLAVTVARNTAGLFRWFIGNTTMEVEWADPSLLQILQGVTVWDNSSAVFQAAAADTWNYIIIETVQTVPHPIHLHGHDFYVLAHGFVPLLGNDGAVD